MIGMLPMSKMLAEVVHRRAQNMCEWTSDLWQSGNLNLQAATTPEMSPLQKPSGESMLPNHPLTRAIWPLVISGRNSHVFPLAAGLL